MEHRTTSDPVFQSNRSWETDRTLMLERSERRAWAIASAAAVLALVSGAGVIAKDRLRSVVEVPIVVDRSTGQTTIQQRLDVETVPQMEALDKHNLATFVRAREGYNWMFLQRDYDQVARMSAAAVFSAYSRQFQGDDALQHTIAGTAEWRINIVSVRLNASGRSGNRSEATVTYEKVAHATERDTPDIVTRHVASVVYEYQPQILAKESDRLENPFGFVVTAYRSDPEVGVAQPGPRS